MNKRIQKFIAFCVCTLLLSSTVSASSPTDSPNDSDIPAPESAVVEDAAVEPQSAISELSVVVSGKYTIDQWYNERDEKYYLFLPSFTDLSSVKLLLSATGEVALGDMAVKNGDTVALMDGMEYPVFCDGIKVATLCVERSENLPAMFVETASGSMDIVNSSKYLMETGTLLFINSDGVSEYDGGLERIQGRGNSSWSYSDKKPYNIKLKDKANLCGMGKSRKWSLLSNHLDPTMLRNSMTFALGDAIGLDYTVEYELIDFYAAGEYYGTYLLCEKIEIDEKRLDITDLEKATEEVNGTDEFDNFKQLGSLTPEPGTSKYFDIPKNPADITGGYLIEHQQANRYKNDVSGFVTNLGQPIILKGPEYASKAQIDYISGFYQEMEDAVYSSTGYNKLGKHYSEYLDIDSIAISYLIQELSSNPDACHTSFFLYKDSDITGDGKLHCAPLWDFDLAYCNYVNSQHAANAFYANITKISSLEKSDTVSLIGALYKHEDFLAVVTDIYFTRLLPAIKTVCGCTEKYGELTSMREMGAEFDKSYEMNYIRWDISIKKLGPKAGINMGQNISYLEEYITSRMIFLFASWIKNYRENTEEYANDELELIAMKKHLLSVEEFDSPQVCVQSEPNILDAALLKRRMLTPNS